MRSRLKDFRVAANLTQSKVATALGISQPHYYRWESGETTVPTEKMEALARILNTSPELIFGKHIPLEAKLYDDAANDEVVYYGEVAIHFKGGGEAILLSISEKSFSDLYSKLQHEGDFVAIESMTNQSVIVRMSSVSDVYFSSDAHDDYGPEHGFYLNHVDVLIPDPHDWEIIEWLACGGESGEEFDTGEIDRVRKMIMITEEQYATLVADGHIKSEELEAEKRNNEIKTGKIFQISTDIVYQLSSGKKRTIPIFDHKILSGALLEITDLGEDPFGEKFFRIEAEGRHRIIFINKEDVDFISVPTHQLRKLRADLLDDLLKDEEAAAARPPFSPKSGRRPRPRRR